jgi:hypothetical protein
VVTGLSHLIRGVIHAAETELYGTVNRKSCNPKGERNNLEACVQRIARLGKPNVFCLNFDEIFYGTLLVWGVFRAKFLKSRQFRGVVFGVESALHK